MNWRIRMASVFVLLLVLPGRGECEVPEKPIGGMAGFRLSLESGMGERELDLDSDYQVDAEREFVLLKGSYPVDANISVYVMGGVCSLDIDYPFTDLPFSIVGFRGDQDIVLGFGGTIVLYERPKILATASADFLSFDSDLSESLGSSLSVTGIVEGQASWQEMSLTGRVAYTDYSQWLPYAGVSYSLVDGDVEISERVGDLEGEEKHDFDGKDLVGLVLGVEYDVARSLTVAAEVGLLSETRVILKASWLF